MAMRAAPESEKWTSTMRSDFLKRAAIRLLKKEMSRMPAEHHSFDFIIDQLQETTTTDRDWASMGAIF
nr:hypothetical protein B0A51_02189 [Rachicladosporium sp. CCFEE 5018]